MKRSESQIGPAKLHVGPGGWVQVDTDNFVAAMVRFYQRDDGRLRVNGLLLDTAYEFDLDVRTMRSFPLATVETLANLPEYREAIERQMGDGTTVTIESDDWPVSYRSVSRRTKRTVGMSLRLRLPQPDHRGRYPDRFYEKIAALYRGLIEYDRSPAQTIAEANNMPVTTVHRWIREARRRNFLGPARAKGSSG